MAEKITPEMMTPTVVLKSAVQKFIAIATNKTLTKKEKKAKITEVVKNKMDLKVLSIRVVSRPWKKATAEERAEFTDLFTHVVVNTYFSLLEKYTNEKVDYLKEEIKKKKYAKINTNIVMSDKNIPVTYKLILRKGLWRIYDFSAEGISMVSTYRSNYKATLKRSGLAGLNKALKAKALKK
ncbi:MAG: ABC transporter substrate-binding protein [Alteromonadaceae bacterium]|nr:ABC transporter substrate-binding protein [Alteromonadaceae bacterium]